MNALDRSHRRESMAAQHPDAELERLERRLTLCRSVALNFANTVGSEAAIVIVALLAVMAEPQLLIAGGATAILVFCHWIGSSER